MTRRRPLNDPPAPSRARRGAPPRGSRPQRARRRGTRVAVALTSVALVVATVVAGGEWLLRQSYFRVQHVTVIGAAHESVAAVLAATGLNAHPPMIDVGAAEVERRLARFTWIGSVTVLKHWPGSVTIALHERTAVAVAFDGHHRLRYVDATGHDLGSAPLRANLPTLLYLHPRHSTWPYQRAGAGAAAVASRLPRAFAARSRWSP